MQCPGCGEWREPEEWAEGPGPFFTVVCPVCGAVHDVSDTPYRLYKPEDDG